MALKVGQKFREDDMEDLITQVPKHIREIVKLTTEQEDQLKKDVKADSKQKEQRILELLELFDKLDINLADVVSAYLNTKDTEVD
jgi:Na+/phosphate symporter